MTTFRCEVCERAVGELFRVEFFGSQTYEAHVCPSCARKPREACNRIFERIFGTP